MQLNGIQNPSGKIVRKNGETFLIGDDGWLYKWEYASGGSGMGEMHGFFKKFRRLVKRVVKIPLKVAKPVLKIAKPVLQVVSPVARFIPPLAPYALAISAASLAAGYVGRKKSSAPAPVTSIQYVPPAPAPAPALVPVSEAVAPKPTSAIPIPQVATPTVAPASNLLDVVANQSQNIAPISQGNGSTRIATITSSVLEKPTPAVENLTNVNVGKSTYQFDNKMLIAGGIGLAVILLMGKKK